jgi:hypothetical protein
MTSYRHIFGVITLMAFGCASDARTAIYSDTDTACVEEPQEWAAELLGDGRVFAVNAWRECDGTEHPVSIEGPDGPYTLPADFIDQAEQLEDGTIVVDTIAGQFQVTVSGNVYDVQTPDGNAYSVQVTRPALDASADPGKRTPIEDGELDPEVHEALIIIIIPIGVLVAAAAACIAATELCMATCQAALQSQWQACLNAGKCPSGGSCAGDTWHCSCTQTNVTCNPCPVVKAGAAVAGH